MADPPATKENESQQQTVGPAREQRTRLLKTLEISPYELVILEKHLLAHDWIPKDTSEEAIDEAVFKFRESFGNHDRGYRTTSIFPKKAYRLEELFEASYFEDLEEWQDRDVDDWKGIYDLKLQRETAKYDAVRAIIVDIAAREERKRSEALQDFQNRYEFLSHALPCLRTPLTGLVKIASDASSIPNRCCELLTRACGPVGRTRELKQFGALAGAPPRYSEGQMARGD
jgi:hypothetical protein